MISQRPKRCVYSARAGEALSSDLTMIPPRGIAGSDVNDALTGHSGGNPVARGYGWKDMVRRFGFSTLNAAVEKVAYPGLDLSRVRWTPDHIDTKGTPRATVGPGRRPRPGPMEIA